jgi:hypothetical protein
LRRYKEVSSVCGSRFAATILALCFLVFSGAALAQAHHSRGAKHDSSKSQASKPKKSHTSKTNKSKGNKTVHVQGYYRKDGTYVAPYDRSAPGTAGPKEDGAHAGSSYGGYRKDYMAEGFTAHQTVQRDKHGRIKRSGAARSAFQREHPCPSTGKTNGRCPGYVVDHIKPLEWGGADATFNMQWQTVADAKAKDKTEHTCRQ